MQIVQVFTLSSQEWAAWVSAGAAVIQAIAAAAAIWYSGKLARDSADRERLADENAARRIAEADAAAEEQRRLDRIEKKAAEINRFNRPIDLAISLAESAYDEIRVVRDRYKTMVEATPDRLVMGPRGVHQTVAQDRILRLESQIDTAELIVTLRKLAESVEPFGAAHVPVRDWLPSIEQRLVDIRDAITAIYIWRKIPSPTGD